MALKILFDHETNDMRDMLFLSHERCEQMNDVILDCIKKMMFDKEFTMSHLLEELSTQAKDVQEYTYFVMYSIRALEKTESMVSENPLVALMKLMSSK